MKKLEELKKLAEKAVNGECVGVVDSEYLLALLADRKNLRAALEFYASQDNWVPTKSDETNLWAYTTIYDDSTGCDNLTGGKRARKALAKSDELE